ncbi:type IV fimbrial biogenesis protein PilW [Xenorhabdus innexi]|uniref:Type IV fimbrial biogenesis protein PilW n=1 Tax=Xenorhabdus innexi TaxID=290109 RepID=A0A2G0NSJ1_9GAMM|nr:type IV fimbrial biogenesis protein PilW [Xenorhabdus innexi]
MNSKKTVPTPHNAAFKRFMAQTENARDFFDIHLPEKIKRLCDFNTLKLTNSSFIDHHLRSKISDVLYSNQNLRSERCLLPLNGMFHRHRYIILYRKHPLRRMFSVSQAGPLKPNICLRLQCQRHSLAYLN